MENIPTNNLNKKLNKFKESKWDKIRKKYNSTSFNLTTETVKKFLDLNFIEKKDLHGLHHESRNLLDPITIMDLRHENIHRKSRQKNNLISDPIKLIQMDKIKEHNKSLEINLIEKEIMKFKDEINFLRPKSLKLSKNNSREYSIDNKKLFETLTNSEDACNNFFRTSISAPLMIEDISSNEDYFNDAYSLNENKSVRFGESVEIITYSKEPSILSGSEWEFESSEDEENFGINKLYVEETKPEVIQEEKPFDESYLYITGYKNEDSQNTKIVKTVISDCGITIKKKEIEKQDFSDIYITNAKSKEEEQIEKNQIINELFSEKPEIRIKEYERELLQKFIQKWIVVTNLEKISRHNIFSRDARVSKINEFLNKIRQEKKVLQANENNTESHRNAKNNKQESYLLAKKYRDKLKTQQSIIELQKMKLERQERIITELKLSKLSDDAKEAKIDLKNELRNVIRTGDVKFRSKAKCLQIIGNLKEDTDEEYENKLHALGCGIPRFLSDMQARASERNTKHAEAQERRLKIEKEKEDAKIALEEAKKLEDEKAKMDRMEALRDKRRKEKLQKIIKEKERLIRLENYKKANDFRRFKLLTRFGMDRLKKLILIKKKNEKKSKELRKKNLLNFGFVKWKLYTIQIWEHRKNQADSFYKKYLMISCLRMWKENHRLEQSKILVAIDWYEMKISEQILREWKIISKQTKMIEDFKMKHAEAHHNWNLKWKVIEHWHRLPTINKIEKETESRRQRWRLKIWELLPDYIPNQDD